MGPLIAAGSGALLVAGVILLVAGLGRRIPDVPVSRPWPVRLVARWRAMGARRRLWVVLCVGAGVVTGIWTGWLAAVVLIPLVLLGIPYLLSEPPNPEVEVLAALADVNGDGDDLSAGGLADPADGNRRVQASGVGQDDTVLMSAHGISLLFLMALANQW